MPIKIVGVRSGRPDYSKPVGIEIPLPRPGIKVVQQMEYWAAGEIIYVPPPGYYTWWVVERGFSFDQEWIPDNQRFSLNKVTISVPAYITFQFGVGVENKNNPGSVTILYWETIKQRGSVDFSNMRVFKGGERPVYFFYNLGDVTPDFIDWSIVGMVEVIE